MMNCSLKLMVVAAIGLALNTSIIGQEPIFEVTGTELLSFISADMDDINGDGTPDVITSSGYGGAFVYSGVDFSLIHAFTSNDGRTHAESAGDVNGDGFNDIIVGYHNKGPGLQGFAKVFSGADGSLIFTMNAPAGAYEFGYAVDGAGDVNGDGFDDLIIGAHAEPSHAGRATVYSGANGAILFTSFGMPGDAFGTGVSGLGDVNGDGFDDVIIGSGYGVSANPSSGRVRVISGFSGSILHEYTSTAITGLGAIVGDAGDVDGDGNADFFYTDRAATNGGSFHLVSGMTGATIHTVYGNSLGFLTFGRAASRAGDIDDDGIEDFCVYGEQPPAIVILSGATGGVIHTMQTTSNSPGPSFDSLAGGKDIDGDGLGDIVYAAGFGLNSSVARLLVYSGATFRDDLYPGTNEGLTLTGKTNGVASGTSVSFAHANDAVSVHLDAPALLVQSQLLLGAQIYPTASGMPVVPGLPIYFDPVATPSPVALFDSAANLFGTPFLPPGGVEVSIGAVPAGLDGVSVGMQTFSLAGALANNMIFAASDAIEIRFR